MANPESLTCPGGKTFTIPDGIEVSLPEVSQELIETIASGGQCVVGNVLKRNCFENEEIRTSADCGRCATHIKITVSPKIKK